MSDFFIGELLVLLLLVPVLLRPFLRALQGIRGIVFLPPVALFVCFLIIAGSGFPVSFLPVVFVSVVAFLGGLARMVRALRGLATDWYSLPSKIFYLVLLAVFLCVVGTAFYTAPENGYLGSGVVNKVITREKSAAGELALRYEWTGSGASGGSGLVVLFGDVAGGAGSRSTLAAVLAEDGFVVRSDDYRSFYAWKHPLLAWPFVRFLTVRLGKIISGHAIATDDDEIYRLTQRTVARTMNDVREKFPEVPLFVVAEGSACVPVAEYLHATSRDVHGFVCLVSPEGLAPLTHSLDGAGFRQQYTVVVSETSMIPHASAQLPVLVLSGDAGSMTGNGELDADDVLAAMLLGGTRDTGRKRAERLARRINDWFAWKSREGEVHP